VPMLKRVRRHILPRLQVPKQWKLTFSFARALQFSVMQQWKGQKENKQSAQQQLLLRAQVGCECAIGWVNFYFFAKIERGLL
jgi:fructose-bisphosphate aldolase class 1